MGIVGAGFVGPHHVDAVRRLGFVEVVAVAGSSQASADKKAEALPYYERLIKEFEKSEYLPLAQKRVAELKTQ